MSKQFKTIENSDPEILKEILERDFKGRKVGFLAQHWSHKSRITDNIHEAVEFYSMDNIVALREAESLEDPGDCIFEKMANGNTMYFYEESLINWDKLLLKHVVNQKN